MSDENDLKFVRFARELEATRLLLLYIVARLVPDDETLDALLRDIPDRTFIEPAGSIFVSFPDLPSSLQREHPSLPT